LLLSWLCERQYRLLAVHELLRLMAVPQLVELAAHQQ
jgi:hypothetical protein